MGEHNLLVDPVVCAVAYCVAGKAAAMGELGWFEQKYGQ